MITATVVPRLLSNVFRPSDTSTRGVISRTTRCCVDSPHERSETKTSDLPVCSDSDNRQRIHRSRTRRNKRLERETQMISNLLILPKLVLVKENIGLE